MKTLTKGEVTCLLIQLIPFFPPGIKVKTKRTKLTNWNNEHNREINNVFLKKK